MLLFFFLVLTYWQLDSPLGRENADQMNQISQSASQGLNLPISLSGRCVKGTLGRILFLGINNWLPCWEIGLLHLAQSPQTVRWGTSKADDQTVGGENPSASHSQHQYTDYPFPRRECWIRNKTSFHPGRRVRKTLGNRMFPEVSMSLPIAFLILSTKKSSHQSLGLTTCCRVFFLQVLLASSVCFWKG